MPPIFVDTQQLRTKATGTSRIATAYNNVLFGRFLTDVAGACTGSASSESCSANVSVVSGAFRQGSENIAMFGVGLATGADNFDGANTASAPR